VLLAHEAKLQALIVERLRQLHTLTSASTPVQLHILSAAQGRAGITQAAVATCAASGSLTDHLAADFGGLPDVDLVLFTGCSLPVANGALPWHIRLAEHHRTATSLRRLSAAHLLRALGQFAACEQRGGR